MADRKVTHQITAEYQGAVDGYRQVKSELAATERANKQAAATAKAASKEVAEAERARSNYLRELERQSTGAVKKFIQERKNAAINAEKEKVATLKRLDTESTNAAKKFITDRRDAQRRAADEFTRMHESAQNRVWQQERAAMWRSQRMMEDAATKAQGGGDKFSMLAGKVDEFKGSILGLVAGYATFEGLIALASKYYGKLEAIAGKQAQMGAGLRELAVKSGDTPKATSADLKRASEQGKRLGVKPEDMASTRAWARDVTGEKGGFDLKSAILSEEQVKLEKLGFEKSSTQDAMGALVRQGKGPREAARSLYASTEAGALSQSSLPKITTSLERYKNLDEGLAVASAFKRTGKMSDKEVASATSSVGEALETSDGAKRLKKEYAKQGIDYDTASMSGKIEDIRALYGDDEKKLVKRGFSEDQAKNIKILMDTKGGVAREQAAMAGVSSTAIDEKLGVLKATPELQPMFGKEEQEAKAGYAAMYGPQAGKARSVDKASADAGSYYMDSNAPGAAWMYDEDTGQANWAGHGLYSAARGSARAFEGVVSGQDNPMMLPFNAAKYSYQESVGQSPVKPMGGDGASAGQGDPELRENTAATRELTEAIKGVKVGGGGGEAVGAGVGPVDRNADT